MSTSCLIFAPLKDYDEPEILHSSTPDRVCCARLSPLRFYRGSDAVLNSKLHVGSVWVAGVVVDEVDAGPSERRVGIDGLRLLYSCHLLAFVEQLRRHVDRDDIVGLRMGHSLSQGEITPARYAAGRHILISRRGFDRGPIDDALEQSGLKREIVTVVSSFSEALALARASDLIASVPERYTGNLRAGLFCFPLPVSMPEVTVSLLWHTRLDADPAHR